MQRVRGVDRARAASEHPVQEEHEVLAQRRRRGEQLREPPVAHFLDGGPCVWRLPVDDRLEFFVGHALEPQGRVVPDTASRRGALRPGSGRGPPAGAPPGIRPPDNPSRVRSSAGVAAKARRRNRCRRSAAVRASPAACSCIRFMVPLNRARHPPAVRRARRAEARPAGRAAGAIAGRPRASTTGSGRLPPADRARVPLRAIPRGSRGRRSSRSAAVRSRP